MCQAWTKKRTQMQSMNIEGRLLFWKSLIFNSNTEEKTSKQKIRTNRKSLHKEAKEKRTILLYEDKCYENVQTKKL